MLFFIIITLIIILNIYFILNLYLVSEDSKLTLCKNMNELKLSLYKKNPSLINIPKNNIDLEIFEDLNPCYKNIDLFNNLNIKSKINFSEILLNSNLCCNLKYSLSYFNKKQLLDFKECNNNYHIISNLYGNEFYIYLLHPKYKHLNNEDLLIQSEKVLIKPYDILIIPFGWKYLQEINEKTINYHIDVDNYFTFIHNSILNKI
tara:strand:+ start:7478 stop:8089 length:612 start_codon:yes stop_codon:yes gene_type:complete